MINEIMKTSSNRLAQYLQDLKDRKIGVFDVPEEYRSNSEIIRLERELGLRSSGRRGFDVIRNEFFVIEVISSLNQTIEKNSMNEFPDFHSYYEFLDGDIYENACYYQYDFTAEEIAAYSIDLSKINTLGFADSTMASIIKQTPSNNILQYETKEKEKVIRKKWITRFNRCKTYEEFQSVLTELNDFKDSQSRPVDLNLQLYLFSYIFFDKEKAFDIIMQAISNGDFGSDFSWLFLSMCLIYDSQRVMAAYHCKSGSSQTRYAQRKRLKILVQKLEKSDIEYKSRNYFEEETHYYCHCFSAYSPNMKNTIADYRIYFETFQGLVDFLKNDLSNTDLSKALLPDIDFSLYKTNDHTILPTQSQTNLTCKTYKGYDRKIDRFVFQATWIDINGNAVEKTRPKTFKYFFNFIYFLENDLSNADLLFCDGLSNIHDFSGIDLTGARLRSQILDQLKRPYQSCLLDHSVIESFEPIVKNENDSVNELQAVRDVYTDMTDSAGNRKIYYITDLHLMHRLNGKCKTEEDATYELQKIIDSIIRNISSREWNKSRAQFEPNVLLIGGDTSSDFNVFCRFIRLLRKSLRDIPVVFLLGNHELWPFLNLSFDEIVRKYESALSEQKMYLLQNNILYSDKNNVIHRISTDELVLSKQEVIKARLKTAPIVLFGGLAFSGQNISFNADNGIYRSIITRNQEIEESKKFEGLYKIVCETLSSKNVIVLTHTPKNDWSVDNTLQPRFVYVSGHTHRNYFYDDGDYRIYADNQIGYGSATPHLKYFYLDDSYDLFEDYADGIYMISREQYIDFYHGKNLAMSFEREINVLYMLKKNGYYCFIYQSKKGTLTILDGGNRKALDHSDVNYYYNNMEQEINLIKRPLDKFRSLQEQIAYIVKKIGGSGKIHGSIVDIDYCNHIYVNPFDGTVTGYYATNIVNKEVFPNVQSLLKTRCPSLYGKYIAVMIGNPESALAYLNNTNQSASIESEIYLDTDIYRASREIKKMQKLSSNILSTWYEPPRPKVDPSMPSENLSSRVDI